MSSSLISSQPSSSPALSKPQFFWPGQLKFKNDRTKSNHALLSGIGTGKTRFGPIWHWQRCEWNKDSERKQSVVVGPNMNQVDQHILPEYMRYLERNGMREGVHFHKRARYSAPVLEIVHPFPYVICFMSFQNYKSFVNWEFDHGWIEEPDFADIEFFEFISQRVGRRALVPQKLFTGVLQRIGWYYNFFGPPGGLVPQEEYTLPAWVDEYAPGYGGAKLYRFQESETKMTWHMSTFENPILNREYFRIQFETYGWNERLFRAQVLGQAVAITKNAVYEPFDETVHIVDHEPRIDNNSLILTFDFNVGQMSWAAIQGEEAKWFVVNCNKSDANTTMDACRQIIQAFPASKWKNHDVTVYGDSYGYARSPQAAYQDGNYQIIEQMLRANFPRLRVRAQRHTVEVETRVMGTNKLLATRRLYVDKRCTKLIQGWQATEWDENGGRIKKGSGDRVTHMPEAVDFAVYQLEPLIERVTFGHNF